MLLCGFVLVAVFASQKADAQGPPPPSGTPTFKTTSTLVFLDVTVLDKQGRPVVTGLTQDDFTITEDKKPQRIFSFEAPEVHVLGSSAGDSNPEGKAPITIFVLDEANAGFGDFAYIRYSMRKYLDSQPAQLSFPAEMMVLSNRSSKVVQGFTRNKEHLLDALNHLEPEMQFTLKNGYFFWDRIATSTGSLRMIALECKDMPGRKNVIWLGPGPFEPDETEGPVPEVRAFPDFVHDTVNMLVQARISLFVVLPGFSFDDSPGGSLYNYSDAEAGETDPRFTFGGLVRETGGELFDGRKHVDAEIKQALEMGSNYYTLTYQPLNSNTDGQFRRIHVTVRDPNLRVVTKVGYFAPDKGEEALIKPDKHVDIYLRQQAIFNIGMATRTSMHFGGLDVQVTDIGWHPDSHTADFTLQLKSTHLNWQPMEKGKSLVEVILGVVTLDGERRVVASKYGVMTPGADTQDPNLLAREVVSVPLTMPIARPTRSVRVVMGTDDGMWMGSVEVDRQAIEAAPATPGPRHPNLKAFNAAGQAESVSLGTSAVFAKPATGGTKAEEGTENGGLARYRNAVHNDPKDPAAHYALGQMLESRGDLEEAIAEFRKVVRLNPNDDRAHESIAGDLGEEGNLAGAIEEYHEALRLNPKNERARAGLEEALALRATGKDSSPQPPPASQ
jgi:VWFA-related protein